MTDIQSPAPKFLVQQTASTVKANAQSVDKAKEAAAQFEAFFLSQVLNSMSSGLKTDDAFGGGESEKMFRSMLNEEYAKNMSRNNSVGIADAVFKEMLKMQEVE
ncbi:MAG: rod-binding protein [Sneathiella sp.]|nr:rod-binding protein [Sneathiella sp.]